MKSLIFPLWLILMSCGVSFAQHISFSDDHQQFHLDVAKGLRKIEIEAVHKIASDFQMIWPRMTVEQKDMIIDIAKIMQKRRLQTRPFFSYYFAYITYAVEQAGLPPDQLTKVLDINLRVINTYSAKQLLQFYTDLNYFFGRNSLYRHHYNSLKFTGGSYEFDYIEVPGESDAGPLASDGFDDNLDQDFDSDLTEDDFADDSWGNDDDWFTDTDADTDSPDSWDSWDPWAEDSTDETDVWGEEKEEEIFGSGGPALLAAPIGDLVGQLIAEDAPPPIVGAIIRFKNVNFEMKSIYDSIGIRNATGVLLIKDRLFIGESGTVEWPGEIRGTDGVTVDLEQYQLKTNIPYIKAVKSKMAYPKYLDGKIDGFFLFKTTKRRKHIDPAIYPRFKSHHADVELRLKAERLKYVGGVALRGNLLTGESVSGIPSTLTVEDEKGNSFKAQDHRFVFSDSVITAEKTKFVIYHGSDSIYHPQVRFNYDYSRSLLTLLKPEGGFKNASYESSFFNMDFNVGRVKWDLKSDSIDFSIMNASNLVPAIFESHDYFHHARLEKLTGVYSFNPLVLTVNYARKIKTPVFYLNDMAGHYNLDAQVLRGALKSLLYLGYIDFQESTSQVLVKPKANHYFQSNLKRKDFDNLLISSLNTAKPNATFRLDSGQLKIRGVERILFTADQAVYAEPENKEVTILKDRDVLFDGMVKSGDFQYKGKDFTFYYDSFIMDMATIDSIHIEVPLADSLLENSRPGDEKKVTLENHITETSGTLYINDPLNKSGEKEYLQYPYFVSSSEAIVYFDRPEILNGAYDKSIKFIVPPFEVDSLNKGNVSGVGFDGTFFSGGIIPPIKQRLEIMPDNSLGFVHKIPEEGYQLYEGQAKLFNEISLDNKGLHADGQIDHISTKIFSDRFTFYMDSVAGFGSGGAIQEGAFAQGSFPQVDFEEYNMTWLPLKDSMYLRNIGKPFNFYNQSATLDGEVIVTQGGTYGSGLLVTRGSEVKSDDYKFAQTEYVANHAKIKVLSENSNKPAMAGNDVFIDFDLNLNIAEIRPENAGEAAISFPYAQMKTSITNAKWFLEDSLVTMTKPDNVPIEESYFFTTRKALDSLAFNATDAVYDIRTSELNISGIPWIIVADAKIIPKGNETTILENAELQEFKEAQIIIDTLNEYHKLFDGNIKILSSKNFIGDATYSLVNAAEDSFAIKFEEFELKEVPRGKKETKLMTVSGGDITEQTGVIISPGFQFKGRATMFADLEALQLQGFVKPIFEKRRYYNYWISYTHDAESPEVSVDFESAVTESGTRVTAGLYIDELTGGIYMSFLEDLDNFSDFEFFKPSGKLEYLLDSKSFRIETASKSSGETYSGKTMLYNEGAGTLIFEGPVNFIKNTDDFAINATVLGVGKPDSGKYSVDALMTLQMNIHKMLEDDMAYDVLEVIERLGAPLANNMDANEVYKIADLAGESAAKSYEEKSSRNYQPLHSVSSVFDKTIVLSNVKLDYSKEEKAWYNTSRIGLSHLRRNDVNATIDGFLEIKRDQEGHDVINLFLQISPTSWYFFNYQDLRLLMYSSNSTFNESVTKNSNIAKAGFGQYTTVIGEQSDALKFINEFRKKYFGITDPYNLQAPDDIFLEDESFETIEKKKDGFGF